VSDPSGPAVKLFLVADLRGSTWFTNREEGAGDAVAAFASAVTEVAAARAGSLELRGGEALLVFDSIRDGIRAAMELQASFANPDASEGMAFPMGIGLAASEAEAVGSGYSGVALEVAARLSGLAGPGEVLASQEVVQLAGTLVGLAFLDRGSIRTGQRTEPVAVVRIAPLEDDPASRFLAAAASDEGSEASEGLRIVVADDSVLFREGLVQVLTGAGFDVVGQVGDGEELLTRVRLDPPDLVITDIRMPPTNTDEGLVAAKQIREELPELPVVVLSQYVETHHAMNLLAESPAGIGYVLKDRVANVGDFADSIRRVSRGQSVIDPEVVGQLLRRRRDAGGIDDLTERERQVLQLMAEGRSNQAICERLFLSPKTVEGHISSIFTKLDLIPQDDDHRRVLAVLAYLRSS
jgi:DNA-binding NarL/FixJ family response regulator/class 3 adenylate cyclase